MQVKVLSASKAKIFKKNIQNSLSVYSRNLSSTYTLRSEWGAIFLKISLALVSTSCVLIGGSQQVKPQSSNSLPLQSGDVVTAKVDIDNPGQTIPWSFSGFSFEHGDVLNFTGKTTTDINPVFVQLLKNIGNNNNGVPTVRIGGASTDISWWNPNNLTKPLGIKYNITNTDLSSLEASLSQTNSKLILGLNLGQNQPSMAVDLARAALSSFSPSRILSFEIGNEPDIYAFNSYYKDPTTGATVYARPSNYSFAEYLPEFANYSTTLKNSFPTMPPLAGPVFTTNPGGGWMQHMPNFLANQSSMVNLITYHRYPLSACSWSQPGSSIYPTISNLLSDKASYELAQGVTPFVNQAKSYGLPLSLSEINSVSCGGTDGVSNSFAAALWGTDVMFNMASVGVQGVNFHTGSNAYYSPFSFKVSKTNSGQYEYTPTVKPLYYGMLLFAQAASNKARLLPVKVQSAGNTKIWATIDNQNVVRVLAINKDLNASGNATIQLSSPRLTGSLVRLTAPNASATNGITLGGQTFDGTTDGNLIGNTTSTVVKPNDGIYTFSLPAASAALLTINPL